MPVTADNPAPYSPGATVLEVIDRRRNRNLPTPITADVLGRAGIAPTLLPRVLQSLQGLDLIDADGMPTAIFEAIRTAPESDYKARLEEWLKTTYADVFAFVDPSKDDETRIRDAFRSYQPIGQQSRMVNLFMALCTAAGLAPEKPTKAAAPRPYNATAAAVTRPRPTQASTVKRIVAQHFRNAPRHASAAKQVPAPLQGLLDSLPREGEGWTTDRRTKFLAAFETVLDLCVPVVPDNAAPTSGQADQEDQAGQPAKTKTAPDLERRF